jgi:hypothetical protein
MDVIIYMGYTSAPPEKGCSDKKGKQNSPSGQAGAVALY